MIFLESKSAFEYPLVIIMSTFLP